MLKSAVTIQKKYSFDSKLPSVYINNIALRSISSNVSISTKKGAVLFESCARTSHYPGIELNSRKGFAH